MSYGQIYVDLGLATVTPTGGSVPMGLPDVAASALSGGSATAAAAQAQAAANTANASLATLNGKLTSTIIPGAIPTFSNYQGSGFPSLNVNLPLTLYNTSNTNPLFGVLNVIKDSSLVTANNNTAAIQAKTTTGVAQTGQEAGVQSIIYDHSTSGNFNALAGQFITYMTATSTSRGWSFLGEIADQSGLSSSARGGAIVGAEWDLGVSLADDQANGATWGGFGTRKGMQFVWIHDRSVNAASAEISSGLWITSDPVTKIDQIIGFGISSGSGVQCYSVLDTRNTIAPAGSTNPVNAVTMPAGQVIDFSGDSYSPRSLSSPPQRYLRYDPIANSFGYTVAGVGQAVSISDAGLLSANFGLSVSGKFVGAIGTPASSSAAGTVGQIETDANYLYVCVASNTWKRIALTSF